MVSMGRRRRSNYLPKSDPLNTTREFKSADKRVINEIETKTKYGWDKGPVLTREKRSLKRVSHRA